jgi:hypothetical protein
MMQQDPYAAFSRPVPAPPVAAPADPYSGIAAPVAAAPARAPQRQPAPARAAGNRPAPSAPLNALGITDEEEIAALTAQYGSREEAIRLQQERMAADPNYDPGMAPAQPALDRADAIDEWFLRRDATRAAGAPVQPLQGVGNEQIRATAQRAYAAPQSGGRIQFQPWLGREPRFASGDLGEIDPQSGEPVINRAGVLERGNGQFEIYDPASDAYYPATRAEVNDYQGQLAGERKVRMDRLAREADPKYQAEYAAAQRGAENIPPWLMNLTQGQSLGAVPYVLGAASWAAPFTDDIDRGLASQAARDAVRDRFDALIANDPLGSVGMQMVGGLLTPGLAQANTYIGRATGATRAGRAAAVSGGYGAASGALNTEGGPLDKGQGALLGGAVGAGAGGLLDLGLQRGAANAAARAANPGPVRQLSRAGVNMTPAQLLSEVPIVGRAAKTLEQGAASIPFVGAVPASAERESVRSFGRGAINQVLDIIGEQLPDGVSGREAIRIGDDLISARYRADLGPVTISPDPQINARIQAAINPGNMSASTRDKLRDSAQDIVDRMQGPLTGEEWKQLDSELSTAINSAALGGPENRPLAQGLRQVRTILGDALEQASPGTLARVRQTDDAYGNFQLIRRAASNPSTGRNDELFTAENLNSVLARSEGRAYGRGEARLQNLTDDALKAMAGTLPNSGTAERLATIGLATGAAGTGAVVNPAVAIPVVAGVSALYSKPVQVAINAIYRATDHRAARAASAALAELRDFAARDPAVQPYYLEAARHIQGVLEGPEQGQTPRATGLLSPTSP